MIKEVFVTIKIKEKTAGQFRIYSRSLGKQQSETLQLMLDFFQDNHLSPLEQLGPNLFTLENKMKARINAVVAILKNIEKTQTKPTLAMLQLLFQESPTKKEVLVEKNSPTQKTANNVQQQNYEKIRSLQDRLKLYREIITALLDHVAVSRSSFGKVQLRLLMSETELQEIKHKFQKI